MSNLVSNAVKYTLPNGSVRVEMIEDGAQITMRVQDSGMGIPIEEQDAVFSKMFRASNARAQITDGTGLGLYIVKEAVKVLKGTISFTSVEAQGTTFTIVFPKT